MTRKDIISMAREAGSIDSEDVIETVYAAFAAAERERIKQANAPEIERCNEYIKSLEDAVAAEREACAKVCESMADRFMQGSPLEGNKPYASHECAAAIRARGHQ